MNCTKRKGRPKEGGYQLPAHQWVQCSTTAYLSSLALLTCLTHCPQDQGFYTPQGCSPPCSEAASYLNELAAMSRSGSLAGGSPPPTLDAARLAGAALLPTSAGAGGGSKGAGAGSRGGGSESPDSLESGGGAASAQFSSFAMGGGGSSIEGSSGEWALDGYSPTSSSGLMLPQQLGAGGALRRGSSHPHLGALGAHTHAQAHAHAHAHAHAQAQVSAARAQGWEGEGPESRGASSSRGSWSGAVGDGTAAAAAVAADAAAAAASRPRARKADWVCVTEDTAIKNAAGAVAKVQRGGGRGAGGSQAEHRTFCS